MRTSTLSLISILPFLSSALGNTKACKPKSSATSSTVLGVAAVATGGSGSIPPVVPSATSAVVPPGAPGNNQSPSDPVAPSVTSVSGVPSAPSNPVLSNTALPAGATALPNSPITDPAANSTGLVDGNGNPIPEEFLVNDPEGWKENYSVEINPNDPTVSYGSHPTFEFKNSTTQQDCGCGYKVSGLGDIWMPYKFEFDFSTIGDAGPFTSENDLLQYGWRINDGHHAGGPSGNGTNPETKQPEEIYQCLGDPGSLSVKNGILELTMRGPQEPSGSMRCPEIIHNNASLYGVFQADIQFTDVPGTCQAFWLNHTIADRWTDELDLEVLGGSIMTASDKQQPGLWSTNWTPMGNASGPLNIPHSSGMGDNKQPTPFPPDQDPTQSFNKYTIAWMPGEYSPRYYNGVEIGSPSIHNANHTMEASLNNWSNNAPGWSGLVPQQNSTMKVKSVLFYYRTKEVQTMSKDCTEADVCVV